jgi:hypothetical protein
MSRAHERTAALLARRVRLGDGWRGALYGVVVALAGSGAGWLLVHFGDSLGYDRSELARIAGEAWALRVHGAAAIVALLAVGAMLATHTRLGWALRRNRSSGSLLVVTLFVLIATGYALYYLVDDASRPPVSVLHWGLGLALLPVLLAHIVLGRRSRGGTDASDAHHHRGRAHAVDAGADRPPQPAVPLNKS